MTTVPTRPGFYWAQWRASDHGHELPPVDDWQVVEVFENASDPDDPEYLLASVCGVAESELLANFNWGDGPLSIMPAMADAATDMRGALEQIAVIALEGSAASRWELTLKSILDVARRALAARHRPDDQRPDNQAIGAARAQR